MTALAVVVVLGTISVAVVLIITIGVSEKTINGCMAIIIFITVTLTIAIGRLADATVKLQ